MPSAVDPIDMSGNPIVGLPDPPPSDPAAVPKVYCDRSMHYVDTFGAGNVTNNYFTTPSLKTLLAGYKKLRVTLYGGARW